MSTNERSPVVVGLAGLGGALAGAILGGMAGGGIWSLTHPNPEGLEGLAVLVVVLFAGIAGSYPGAVAGVWLAVRGRPGARRTVLWAAALYPLVAVVWLLEVMGLSLGEAWVAIAILLGFGAGFGARALAERPGPARGRPAQ